MRLEQNQDTHQVVLWCLGEVHQDVALDRLRSRYGVQVDAVPHRVSLRETFAAPSTGRGRHVKQSGGHGQYAICEIDVEPLPPGSGIEFVDKVVGGAVPRQFVPSVEKGCGPRPPAGSRLYHPLVDVRITLRDGKSHSVDSSDAAFQTAGALALREAAADTRIQLLEPVAEVRVLVPDDYVGPVMSDLSGRRGRVIGTEQSGTGRTLVRAEVPELEIGRYAVDLRSLSHGSRPVRPGVRPARSDAPAARRTPPGTAGEQPERLMTGHAARLCPQGRAARRSGRYALVPAQKVCRARQLGNSRRSSSSAASGGDSGQRRIRFLSRSADPAPGFGRTGGGDERPRLRRVPRQPGGENP